MSDQYWKDKNILIIGASSDLCTDMLPVLVDKMGKVGLHYNTNAEPLIQYSKHSNVRLYQQNFVNDRDYQRIINDFCEWSKSLNYLIIMMGNCTHPKYWSELSDIDMADDYCLNTIAPMMVAKNAAKCMLSKKGLDRRIIFTGTSSAQHGGGSNSLSYGAAKNALECIMKRMAKDLAGKDILVNMVSPGFIMSKLQRRMKTNEELDIRAKLVPLKRPGTYSEVAAAYFYLLSEHSSFVTGENLNVNGGDFI